MSKSKQKSYGDAKVICPYYDSQETVQINCAPAVYDSSGLRVVFRSKVKKMNTCGHSAPLTAGKAVRWHSCTMTHSNGIIGGVTKVTLFLLC